MKDKDRLRIVTDETKETRQPNVMQDLGLDPRPEEDISRKTGKI